VNLPLGIAAGPLLNGRFVKAALDKGFDIPVYKTVRTRRYASHAWPNVLAVHPKGDLPLDSPTMVGDEDYGEPLSITNSFGVPSFDPEFWQPDIADAVAHARRGQVVVASFQGTISGHGDVEAYIEDFALAARLLSETGVKIIEANLSCPNEGTANLLCFDVERARRVVERIREEIGSLKLMVKAAYFRDEEKLRAFVRDVASLVDGVVAINTLPAEIVDDHGAQALPGEGRLSSGVCGRSIKWAGLEMSRRLAKLRAEMGLNFSIIGVGGLSDAKDYRAYREAGADAAMMATAAMWNPRLAQEIKSHEMQEALD
jgi:dihydroorotate dehydrogenase